MQPNSEAAAFSATEKDLTYVEGVGYIPRDIYKCVKSDPLGDLPRYSVHIRIQHILMLTSFLILCATGLPLYFSDLFWAPWLVRFFGGVDTSMFIHKVAACGYLTACGYHLVTIVAGTIGKAFRGEFDYKRTMIPRVRDLSDMFCDLRYFLGLQPQRPKMEKFMYKQKIHYLAIIWGSTVMLFAGLALLFPDTMARLFPETLAQILPGGAGTTAGFPEVFQQLARLMHADEAVMALLVIAFWHWTNVHLAQGRFPIQWTFLTGRITREHQIEEHFLEYLNNLREIPEEKEYMKEILEQMGL